ncbi:MAG: tRNA-specific adenosine deaminase [Neisseriaceae bacterium]|nr:tRNA-specific adenosine deaminase [Neisseriaceae bacterium]
MDTSHTPIINFVPQVLNVLHSWGIFTPEDLAKIGAVSTFLQLKAHGLTLTRSVLWRLDAFSRGLSLQEIDEVRKQQLNNELKNHPPVKIFPTMEKMNYFMQTALSIAKNALDIGEIPVGAIVVRNNEIIACSHNSCLIESSVSSHAEINAINLAAKKLGRYHLSDCDLYVTLEPCAMCAGAIINARINRLIFGLPELKSGMAGSVGNLFANRKLNSHTAVLGNICAKESHLLLSIFFDRKRKR